MVDYITNLFLLVTFISQSAERDFTAYKFMLGLEKKKNSSQKTVKYTLY